MALTPQQELDNKTKKVVGARVEKGKEFGAYQTAEKQLLAIQAEQQQNLAAARAEAQSDLAQNELLTEAAGVVAAQTPVTPQQVVAQPVNPATQAVLSKYGVGQPRFQKTQSHQSTVTKQNVVINNNTTTNTTNNVAVPANIGGPIQGRPIQFKPAPQQDDKGKLKLWLDNTTNRMAEKARQRDRLFERREISLSKAARKVMDKLSELGQTIGEKLDARRIGTTFMSQLKVLGFLFGLHLLTRNWRKIITGINRIETGIKEFYSWLVGKDGEESGLVKEIKYLLGGERDDIRSLKDVFWDLFFCERPDNLGLWPLIRNFFNDVFEDRKKAVNEVVKNSGLNEMVNGWNNVLGGVFAGTGIDKIFGDMLVTLGNILSAVVGGTGALKAIHAKQALAQHTEQQISDKTSAKGEADYQKTSSVGNGDTSSGDYGTAKRGIMAQDVDREGNLNATGLGAGFRQGNEMIYALNSKNKVGTMDVMTGFQRLQNLASEKSRSENPYIILPRAKSTDGAGDFFGALEARFGIDPNDQEWKAIKNEALRHGRYKLVSVPKTKEEATPPPEAIQEMLASPIKTAATKGMAIAGGLFNNKALQWGSVILSGYEAAKSALGEDAASKLQREGYFNKYIIKMVPIDDPTPAISIDGKKEANRLGYGIDAPLLDRIRRVISRSIGMDDSFKFDISDAASMNAANAQLTKSKTTRIDNYNTYRDQYNRLNSNETAFSGPNNAQKAYSAQYFAMLEAQKKSSQAAEKLKKYNETRANIINKYGIKPEEEANSKVLQEELKKAGFDPTHDYQDDAETSAQELEMAYRALDVAPSNTQAETEYMNQLSEDENREAEWNQRLANFGNDIVNKTQAGKGVKHAVANFDATTNYAADVTGLNFLRTNVGGYVEEGSNRVASAAVDKCTFAYDGSMSPTVDRQKFPSYNPDRAINWIHNHLKNRPGESASAAQKRTRSGWQCAKHVRLALAEGLGIPGKDIRAYMKRNPGVPANMYAQSMPDIGFVPLSFNGYVPQKGDVAIMKSNPSHKMGHIGIYDGRDWLADYKYNDRGSMFSARDYAQYGNQAVVFRHFSLMNPAKGKPADLTRIGANSGTVSGAYVNYNKGKPLKYSANKTAAEFMKGHQAKWKNFLLSQGKSEADAERLSGFYAAQDAYESKNGQDYKAVQYHNYGGMKADGGYYHYKSDEEYFAAKQKMMENKFGRALQAKDAMEYAEILGTAEANNGYRYYMGDVDQYKAGMASKVASANQYNNANIALGNAVASGGQYEPGIEGAIQQAKGWLGQWLDDDGSFDFSGFIKYLTDAVFNFGGDMLSSAADVMEAGKEKLEGVVEDLTGKEVEEEKLANVLPEVVVKPEGNNGELSEETKKTLAKYTNLTPEEIATLDEQEQAALNEIRKGSPLTNYAAYVSSLSPDQKAMPEEMWRQMATERVQDFGFNSPEEYENYLKETLPAPIDNKNDLASAEKTTTEGEVTEATKPEGTKPEPSAVAAKPTLFEAAVRGDYKSFAQLVEKKKKTPEELMEEILECLKKISGDTGLANDIASVAAQSNAAGLDRLGNINLSLAGTGRQKVSPANPSKQATSYLG